MRVMLREWRILAGVSCWVAAVSLGLVPAVAQDIGGSAVSNPLVDAARLTTGTLPDARLSSNIPRLDETNLFDAGQVIRSPTTNGVDAVIDFLEGSGEFGVDGFGFRAGYLGSSTNEFVIRAGNQATTNDLLTLARGSQYIKLAATSITANGSEILTEADEGTGNGLDADTVDGLEASAFVRGSVDMLDDDFSVPVGFADITGLSLTLPAGTYYLQVWLELVSESGSTESVGFMMPDLPTGARMRTLGQQGASYDDFCCMVTGTNKTLSATTTQQIASAEGVVVLASSTAFAPQVSAASASVATVKAGSFMRAVRLD